MVNDLLKQAIQAHQTEAIETAEKIYLEILTLQPENADALHLLGILYAQTQRLDLALTYLKKCCEYYPKVASYQNSLGNLYFRLGELKTAELHYENSLTLAPSHATTYSNLGNISFKTNDFEKAKYYYQKSIELNPHLADAHYNLGTIYLNENQIEKAEQSFAKTLRIDPKHLQANFHLGHLKEISTDYPAAIHFYEICLGQNPSHALSHQGIANAYLNLNDLDQAIHHFQVAIQNDPNILEAYHNLGIIYLQKNDLSEALKYYLRLIGIKADRDAHYNAGVIYLMQEKLSDALSHFESTLKFDETHIDCLINLAITHLKQNKIENAIHFFQRAKAIDPDNLEVAYLLNALKQEATPNIAPAIYVKNLFNQYAPYFDKQLREFLHYETPEKIINLLLEVAEINPYSLKILDLGCGTGLSGRQLKPFAKTLIGIDLSEKMLAIAEKKNIYDELISADINTAIKNFQAIDLITAIDVFTYIGDLEILFKNISSALKPNGLLAFSTEITTKENFELQTSARFSHQQKYIENLLKTNQFEILAIKTTTIRTQFGAPIMGNIFIARLL